MRKRFAVVIGVAALGAAGIAGLALADFSSYNDPRRDVRNSNLPPDWRDKYDHLARSFDFVKATAGHSGADLEHTVKLRGDYFSPELLPWLNISTDKAKDPEYRVFGLLGDGAVKNRDTGEKAPAEISAFDLPHDRAGFKYVFSPDSIGKPNKYRWQFVYHVDRHGYPKGPVVDKAPNDPKKHSR